MIVLQKILLVIIRIYQFFISPLLGQNCRFYPSCSNYAKEAIATHGAIKGSWVTIKRIAKCHPFSDGGYDPINKEK